MFFDVSEEEHVKKEVKNFAYFNISQPLFIFKRVPKTTIIHSENLSKYDKVSRIIFSPPPDMA